MKILVSAGSKHGATAEIAFAIADALSDAGFDAVSLAPEAVTDVSRYDAVVLGSGVYASRWVGSVKQLVERETTALKARPVWLFSSGPVGTPPKPDEVPADVAPMRDATAARDHRIFAGRIDSRQLGFGERAILRMVKAPDGDFRSWDEIRAWAGEIAAALLAPPAVPAVGEAIQAPGGPERRRCRRGAARDPGTERA